MKQDSNKYKKNRQWLITFVIGLMVVAVAICIMFFVVIGVSRVDGESMMPTLSNEETLIFYRLDGEYTRGEIIAIKMPNGERYVKRVIGVPGDEIDIRDGVVYLNGEALDENYTQGDTNPSGDSVQYPITVTKEKVFVLGDNREHSTDSRDIGLVSYHAVLGKILGGK